MNPPILDLESTPGAWWPASAMTAPSSIRAGVATTRTDQSLWYVFDDRQMYRPGETAHFKGWVRRLTDERRRPTCRCRRRRHHQLTTPATGMATRSGRATVDLNSLGGFDFEVDNSTPAPTWARPGSTSPCQRRKPAYENGHNHSFQIQEFRRPEFEVTTRARVGGAVFRPPNRPRLPSRLPTSQADRCPNADVEWTVTTRQATYSPPNWDDFTFRHLDPLVVLRRWTSTMGSPTMPTTKAGSLATLGPQFDPATVETFCRQDRRHRHPLPADGLRRGRGRACPQR